MQLKTIEVKITLGPGALEPTRATSGSAGYDLYASEEVILAPQSRALVNTSVSVSIPDGFEGQVRSRSGLAVKNGVIVLNAPGTIDSDYRGEIRVILYNSGHQEFKVEKGTRIAQLVISQYYKCDFSFVVALDQTTRGEGGFGSTGSN
jgi:dUTP pyrophosphatase